MTTLVPPTQQYCTVWVIEWPGDWNIT